MSNQVSDWERMSPEVNPIALAIPTLACLFSTLKGGKKSYEGYQVFRVKLNTTEGFSTIHDLFVRTTLDFLTDPVEHKYTDIVICPEISSTFKQLLQALRIPHEVTVKNLARAISSERLRNNVNNVQGGDVLDWKSYHRLCTIQSWLDLKAQEHPKIVSVVNYGQSTEGRLLKVLKISPGKSKVVGNGDVKDRPNGSGVVDNVVSRVRPSVWLDGGIHAREWISPAVATYVANEVIKVLVRGDDHPDYGILGAVDWYINPMLNPDGYEFTQVDRLWRKTRSKNSGLLADSVMGCVGVDANRNWGHKWGGKGTSNNPCSQIYKGPKASSEPEVRHTQNFLVKLRDSLKLVLSLHSYSQVLLTPWGYDKVVLDDMEDLLVAGDNAVKAIADVHGTDYQCGSTGELLYPAAGGSHDFARGALGVKYAYVLELRDKGKNGFLLPQDQILPTAEETFVGLKSLLKDSLVYHNVVVADDIKKNDQRRVKHIRNVHFNKTSIS